MVKIALFIPPVILISSLAACNLQAAIDPTPTAAVTTQVQPIASKSTAATSATPTSLTPTTDPAAQKSATPRANTTPSADANAASATVQPCNRAAAGNPIDISIPDDSVILPGQAFTKTWRLVNIGTCTWTREYALVWFSGENFGAAQRQLLSGTVAPGQSYDFSVDMRAPQLPGTYQSNWKLSQDEDGLFGIGPSGDSPFWVRIVVQSPATPSAEALPTLTATPVVYQNGVANLPPGSGLDLDTNQVVEITAGDLAYTLDANGSYILTPQNGSMIGGFSTPQPSLNQCQTESLSSDPITLDNVAVGSYFCFQTGQSLPGWVRLVLISPSDSLLALEVLTWAVP